jgi:hypothetical protein
VILFIAAIAAPVILILKAIERKPTMKEAIRDPNFYLVLLLFAFAVAAAIIAVM